MSITRLLNPRGPTTSSIKAAVGRGYIYDADAETYIQAVEAADGQRLEWSVRQAISQFVAGCKTDGIWTAIKASCILCGARTLSGALTALVGSNPTNNNFVSGDYSRTTGLVGNGSTKYLNSNRANNADGQNDCHLAIWKNDTTSQSNPYFIGATTAVTDIPNIVGQNGMYSNSTTSFANTSSSAVGLHASSRASSTVVSFKRPGGSVTTANATTSAQSTKNHYVFAINNGSDSPALHSSSRFLFYSIGSSIDLALLDTRVTRLYYAIGAALA